MERYTIPISDLELDDNQSRVDNSVDESFVESIENVGILQNLVVRPGEDRYKIIAGSRRYAGAVKAGLTELPCSVIEVNDDEATRASIIENTQREDLTQYETVRSVKMWYDVLCEDLPQANDEGGFESPIEEGKTFDSRSDLKNYLSQPTTPSDNLSTGVITESDVKKKISSQSPYNEKTVKRLIRLGKLPHKILILLKTQEERTSEEQDTVETRFSSEYTFNTDSNSAVSTKFLEIDKLLRKAKESGLSKEHYPEFVYNVLERREISSNTTLLDIRSEFNDVIEKYRGWEDKVIEKARIEKAAMGETPPEPEPEVSETEGKEKEETINRAKKSFSSDNTDTGSDEETEEEEEQNGSGVGELKTAENEEGSVEEKDSGVDVKSLTSDTERSSSWTPDKSETSSQSSSDEENDTVKKEEGKEIQGEFILKCFGETVDVDLTALKEIVEDTDFTPEEAVKESEVEYVEG